MTCRELEPVLARIAGSEAAPRLALDAARHLGRCVSCAERLLRMREMSGLLDRIPQIEVPAAFTQRVLRALPKIGRTAGRALVLVAAAVLGAYASRGTAPWARGTGAHDPSESMTSAMVALVALARSLAAVLTSGLEAAPIVPLRLPGLPGPLSMHVFILVAIAALGIAASGAAFGNTALSFRRERRTGRQSPT